MSKFCNHIGVIIGNSLGDYSKSVEHLSRRQIASILLFIFCRQISWGIGPMAQGGKAPKMVSALTAAPLRP